MKKSYSEKISSQERIKSDDESKGKNTRGPMQRSFSEKILLFSPSPKKLDDNKNARSNRFLITVNVFGSPGPLRFVVNEDDTAAKVIETALKRYAREGRLPQLGTDIKPFLLYTVPNGFHAIKSSEAIGSSGLRNFVMRKQITESTPNTVDRKGSGWRACFQNQKVSI